MKKKPFFFLFSNPKWKMHFRLYTSTVYTSIMASSNKQNATRCLAHQKFSKYKSNKYKNSTNMFTVTYSIENVREK